MLDNIFTYLLLPNVSVEAHREAYKKNFGLTDHQVDMIRSLQPRRDYLLVQNSKPRILHAAFPPEVLAFVRSEATILNLYNKIREQHSGGEWKEVYLETVLNR